MQPRICMLDKCRDAYALYLKGRYGWNQRSRANLEAAIPHFNLAIASGAALR